MRFYSKDLVLFSLEDISEGLLYDPRDIQRFNENDGYAMMFVQHGQYENTFDEKRALKIFHEAMIWRKQNNIFGRSFFLQSTTIIIVSSFRYFNR